MPATLLGIEKQCFAGEQMSALFDRRLQGPRWFIHGHQHVDQETQIGDTRVIGVYGQKWLTIA